MKPEARADPTGAVAGRPQAVVPGTIDQSGELRQSAVESMRAIAALSVLAFHCLAIDDPTLSHTSGVTPLYAGQQGVFLFFALTGYLLFRPFARRARRGATPIRIWDYVVNRAARILPLYYTVLVVLLIFVEHGGTAGQWLRFVPMLENFSRATVGRVDTPMWSLAVEVEFYILLPIIALALASSIARGPAVAAAVLVGVGTVSYLLRLDHVVYGDDDLMWWYSLPTTFVFFVPGMLLALLDVEWRERGAPRWLEGPLGSSGVWLGVAAVVLLAVAASTRQLLVLDLCILVVSFAAVGACTLPLRRGAGLRALEWRPLATVGIASYSLYLWHVPLLSLLHTRLGIVGVWQLFAVGLPAACLFALLSYRVVESPFLRLRRRWAQPSRHGAR